MVDRLSRELTIKVRYAKETQQGLNYARNCGVSSSQGVHFTFVDDDIHVSPRWLAMLAEAFARTDADAIGGRIHLDPSIKLPSWVVPGSEISGFLGYQDFGDEPFQMDGKSRYPFGGNMSFHRRVVARISPAHAAAAANSPAPTPYPTGTEAAHSSPPRARTRRPRRTPRRRRIARCSIFRMPPSAR